MEPLETALAQLSLEPGHTLQARVDATDTSDCSRLNRVYLHPEHLKKLGLAAQSPLLVSSNHQTEVCVFVWPSLAVPTGGKFACVNNF